MNNAAIHDPYKMYKREGVIPWVASEGGPLLLLSVSDADLWNGVGPELGPSVTDYSHPSTGTDYSRACAAVNGTVALISVGDAAALAVDGFNQDIGVMKDKQGQFLLVAAERMDDEKEIVDALLNGSDALTWNATDLMLNLSGDALLFDSALPGTYAKQEGSGLRIPMPPGRYQIYTAVFQPDKWTRLTVYRFTAAK